MCDNIAPDKTKISRGGKRDGKIKRQAWEAIQSIIYQVTSKKDE